MATSTSVLVAGAGPTGLVLALWLARRGVPVRVVDKEPGPGEASRAMIVHARTLEFYRQLGFAEAVVRSGIEVERAFVREGGKVRATLPFGAIGQGLSPYPFLLSFPQDDHERLLVGQLEAAGVAVEWGVELTGFEDRGDRVRATLRGPLGEETCEAAYLCGCDGAHSAVRHGLGFEFPGGPYEQLFFVADVQASGEVASPLDLSMYLAENEFCLVLPIRSSGMHRLIGIVPRRLIGDAPLAFDELRPHVESITGVRVDRVNWFSTYRVHHRVASHFRKGRAFIAGDAGHIHSPAGGQGMNTGIGDAVNLAWKLAAVIRQGADPALLDTYEPERIAFARQLVATTDRAFRLVAGKGLISRILRTLVIPYTLPLALRSDTVRRAMFRRVSQIQIEYHQSRLSRGVAGTVRGGDRLPWVEGPDVDNSAPLQSLDWQVHVYGAVGTSLREAVAACGLSLHVFPWTDAARRAGLERDAYYLVRPDGYVALACEDPADVQAFHQFVAPFGLGRREFATV